MLRRLGLNQCAKRIAPFTSFYEPFTMESPENAQLLQRQAMNRSSFYMLLFLFSLLFLNFSEDEATRRGRPTIDDLLQASQLEKEVLTNATFETNVSHVSLFSGEKTNRNKAE